MRRASVGIAAALVTLSLAAMVAAPQEGKDARGKVTAVSADSITVDVNGQAMTFTVNPSTQVIARGAGTKARETEKMTGQKPTLTDIVKVGDNVEVRYSSSAGTMVAMTVRAGLPAAATPPAAGAATKRIQGVVTEVSGTGIAIKPASGEAMKFMVDDKARVTGTGLGTMAKEKQETAQKLRLTDAVAMGDTVEVTYTGAGDMMHATAVRVIKKGT
jgi:hypothetical protein